MENNTNQLIDLISRNKLDKANGIFTQIMRQKQKESLDTERVSVAQNFLKTASDEDQNIEA